MLVSTSFTVCLAGAAFEVNCNAQFACGTVSGVDMEFIAEDGESEPTPGHRLLAGVYFEEYVEELRNAPQPTHVLRDIAAEYRRQAERDLA